MNRLYLKFPTIEDKQSVLNFRDEFFKSGQNFSGSGELEKIDLYEEWLEKVKNDLSEETCGEGRVPSTEYLVYRKEDNKLIGMVQIRHRLSESLFKRGGHIGDSIRPSEQGKGYGTEQIGLALEECRKFGIEKVLMTCKKSNIASARTIQKNGGILEDERVGDDGEIFQRYWIDLK